MNKAAVLSGSEGSTAHKTLLHNSDSLQVNLFNVGVYDRLHIGWSL